MKRYFIILIALVVLFALPVFAGIPTAENAPILNEDDGVSFIFLNDFQMSLIQGNEFNSIIDPELSGAGPMPPKPVPKPQTHTTGGGPQPYSSGADQIQPIGLPSGGWVPQGT